MQRVLIVARCDVGALRGDPFTAGGQCRLIGISPRVSDDLADAGLPHRCVVEYSEYDRWDELHARVWSLLGTLPVPVSDRPRLEDWSHFVVAELQPELWWANVAVRIILAEQPVDLRMQHVPEFDSTHRDTMSLGRAFDLLRQRWESWPS